MDKHDIIDVIQRYAAAHGGQPPGVKRIHSVAGIRSTDWCGKFWARWSDALKEAGFDPNPWRKGYDEAFLVERLVGLMREMGRPPTVAEHELKRRDDPTLPSANTYRKRLGVRHALLGKVRAYCQERPAYSDVVAMCDVARSKAILPGVPRLQATAEGYVYMLRSGRFYKIGRTNCIGRRTRELAIQLPQRAATVHTILTDDPVGVEAYWHRRFADQRKNGEFFALTFQEVHAFKRWRRI